MRCYQKIVYFITRNQSICDEPLIKFGFLSSIKYVFLFLFSYFFAWQKSTGASAIPLLPPTSCSHVARARGVNGSNWLK